MIQLKLSPLPMYRKTDRRQPESEGRIRDVRGTKNGKETNKYPARRPCRAVLGSSGSASATQPNRFQSPYQHSEKAVLIFHRPRHFQKRIVCIRIHTNTLARTSYILKTIFVIDFEDKCIYFVRNIHLLLLKSCRHLHYLILLYTKNP